MNSEFNHISNNIFGIPNGPNNVFAFSFNNSKLRGVQFHNNIFNEELNFWDTIFNYPKINMTFHKNFFETVFFTNSKFNGYISFTSCKFNDSANFEAISTDHNTNFHFNNLEFNAPITLNQATINNLTIERTTFKEITSFQNTVFGTIHIDTTTFEKFAYFDDIDIIRSISCNRRTLRTIKQQLQKADNKIDYNRFRNYELQAYYQELRTNGKSFFDRDRFILWATKWATGFDHNWKQALIFTLFTGMLIYSFFYIFENYYLHFDILQWKSFFSGYLRFLLITDFYNPLIAEKREYIDKVILLAGLSSSLAK